MRKTMIIVGSISVFGWALFMVSLSIVLTWCQALNQIC